LGNQKYTPISSATAASAQKDATKIGLLERGRTAAGTNTGTISLYVEAVFKIAFASWK
jgi:hypothetical protein